MLFLLICSSAFCSDLLSLPPASGVEVSAQQLSPLASSGGSIFRDRSRGDSPTRLVLVGFEISPAQLKALRRQVYAAVELSREYLLSRMA